MNEPRFQVYQDVSGHYRWRLKAGNGEIVAAGEAYASKQNAINAAFLVQQIAQSAKVYA